MLLEQANYTRIDPADVKLILTSESHYGLDLQVDMHAFDRGFKRVDATVFIDAEGAGIEQGNPDVAAAYEEVYRTARQRWAEGTTAARGASPR